MKPYKLVVLCHANRWRSPLAHAFIEQTIQQLNEGAANPISVQVVSAGFKDAGRKAGKPVRMVAKEFGMDLEAHRSSTVTSEMVADADLVVYMDGGNFNRLCKVHNIRRLNHAPLGKLCSPPRERIEDLAFISPYTEEAKFTAVVLYIRDACRRLVIDVIVPEAKKRQARL